MATTRVRDFQLENRRLQEVEQILESGKPLTGNVAFVEDFKTLNNVSPDSTATVDHTGARADKGSTLIADLVTLSNMDVVSSSKDTVFDTERGEVRMNRTGLESRVYTKAFTGTSSHVEVVQIEAQESHENALSIAYTNTANLPTDYVTSAVDSEGRLWVFGKGSSLLDPWYCTVYDKDGNVLKDKVSLPSLDDANVDGYALAVEGNVVLYHKDRRVSSGYPTTYAPTAAVFHYNTFPVGTKYAGRYGGSFGTIRGVSKAGKHYYLKDSRILETPVKLVTLPGTGATDLYLTSDNYLLVAFCEDTVVMGEAGRRLCLVAYDENGDEVKSPLVLAEFVGSVGAPVIVENSLGIVTVFIQGLHGVARVVVNTDEWTVLVGNHQYGPDNTDLLVIQQAGAIGDLCADQASEQLTAVLYRKGSIPCLAIVDYMAGVVVDEVPIGTALNATKYKLNKRYDGAFIATYRLGNSVASTCFSPAPTSIQYEVSLDGGASFRQITPGAPFLFAKHLSEGGTPIASSNSSTANRAFDSSLNSYWSSESGTKDGGHWIGYDMGHEVIVRRIQYQPDTSNTYAVTSLVVEYSSDGHTWHPHTEFSASTSAQDLLLDHDVKARFWRVRSLAGSGNFWRVYDLRMYSQATTVISTGNSVVVRATLVSPRKGLTPHLRGLTVSEWPGEPAATTKTLLSRKLEAANPTARALIVPQQELNGGTIQWFITNDGGVTWLPATPHQPVNFSNWGGADVRVRAEIFSPQGERLSPIIRGYTLITADVVPAALAEERVKANTINIMKTNFKVDALSGAGRNSMQNLVIDALNDDQGIDSGVSSGYVFDPVTGSVVAIGSGLATVISQPTILAAPPTRVYFAAEDELGSGSILYFISWDDGVTWKPLLSESTIAVDNPPADPKIRVKAEITGGARLLAWAWAWD